MSDELVEFLATNGFDASTQELHHEEEVLGSGALEGPTRSLCFFMTDRRFIVGTRHEARGSHQRSIQELSRPRFIAIEAGASLLRYAWLGGPRTIALIIVLQALAALFFMNVLFDYPRFRLDEIGLTLLGMAGLVGVFALMASRTHGLLVGWKDEDEELCTEYWLLDRPKTEEAQQDEARFMDGLTSLLRSRGQL